MNRRKFIQKAGLSSFVLATMPYDLFAQQKDSFSKLTILHTNDTHSRILAFPKGSRYEGLGGVAKRASIISQIRKEEENVLLLDSGDIFQGTPFFNEFGGELELKLMSEMGYDASTLGNHDFDAGMDGLVKQLHHAKFPFLNVNYEFINTPLENKIEQYKIFEKGALKIGVFGVGIELEGLVPEKLYSGITYTNPIIQANKMALELKENFKCDYIICLSHLGLKYKSNKVSDIKLAEKSRYIDLILGGHTHSFLDEPLQVNNLENKIVTINQVGWAGIILGRLDLFFENKINKKSSKCNPVIYSRKTIVK